MPPEVDSLRWDRAENRHIFRHENYNSYARVPAKSSLLIYQTPSAAVHHALRLSTPWKMAYKFFMGKESEIQRPFYLPLPLITKEQCGSCSARLGC